MSMCAWLCAFWLFLQTTTSYVLMASMPSERDGILVPPISECVYVLGVSLFSPQIHTYMHMHASHRIHWLLNEIICIRRLQCCHWIASACSQSFLQMPYLGHVSDHNLYVDKDGTSERCLCEGDLLSWLYIILAEVEQQKFEWSSFFYN